MAKDSAQWGRLEVIATIIDEYMGRKGYAKDLLNAAYDEGYSDGMKKAGQIIDEQFGTHIHDGMLEVDSDQ
jgi:hypothetical protein